MIWILTLFPEYFLPLLNCGIVGQKLQGLRGHSPKIQVVQLRDYAQNKYASVDDKPFGGAPGMILRPDILKLALDDIKSKAQAQGRPTWVIIPTPGGKIWNHSHAQDLSKKTFDYDLVFICGRYEGIDQRFIDLYCNEEFSLGDFILSGGEIPAMAMIDSLIRHIPETLGNSHSLSQESFQNFLLEGPQYTKPRVFENLSVPEVLLNGHHQKIVDYNFQQSIEKTKKNRPDLWTLYEKSHPTPDLPGTSTSSHGKQKK